MSPVAMEATGDRQAGTQSRRGSSAKQRGPAAQATGVRRSYHRLAVPLPPAVRDTPYGWAAPERSRQKEWTCGPTHRHIWGHPPNRETWTGWPRHCLPKHLWERLKGQLN